jgi:uncharacterized MnhB-related membrane protein
VDPGLILRVLDLLLALALLGAAWFALYRSDTTRVVLLFFGFGFLMTLVWVRLGAPDLALAEAAVGTGVTGAMLIGLLARLHRETEQEEQDD